VAETGSEANRTVTAVPGIRVGHAEDAEARTGCTVALGPFRAAAEVRGLASGTREMDTCAPLHIVEQVDAIVLTGGSAYGLAAADGVARWLEARGRGFPTPAARVAIVPAAVLYDLGVGRADRRPDAAMGAAACEAASTGPVAEGSVGAGTGATVGKVRGVAHASPGGVGSWAERVGAYTVGAIAVVNAFGDVVDGSGRILAGARADDGSFLDTAAYVRRHGAPPGFGVSARESTTLALVATDRPFTRLALQAIARAAANAICRYVVPAATPLDGDVVFACSTARDAPGDADPRDVLRFGLWAEHVLGVAIRRAVGARA
jgi:L-aminopeptidase/D-esterase-like protein